jgi:uncharacterized membrane protein
MESRVKLAGHAVHPMLVIFPLGLLFTSLVFDVIFLVTRNTGFAFASFAAVGLWHGITSLAVIALFAGSWVARFLGSPSRPRRTCPLSSRAGSRC